VLKAPDLYRVWHVLKSKTVCYSSWLYDLKTRTKQAMP